MAIDPYSQVFQGQPDTGAAFILSGNKGADVFAQNIAQMEQSKRLAELQRQKTLQAQSTANSTFLSKVNPKDYWQPHEAEINTEYQDFLKKAAAKSAQGINIQTDPEIRSQQMTLENKAKVSGELYNQSIALQKEIQDNPGKYSEESIQKAMSYFDPKKPLSQFTAEGAKAPLLEPKYTLSGMLKGLKGTSTERDGNGRVVKEADRSKNVQMVLGLQDTPDFKYLVKEAGGNPAIPAFPIKQNGKTLFPTTDEALLPEVQRLIKEIRPSEYADFGLMATTPEEAGPELLAIMKQQNQAYGKVVSTAADQLDAGVNTSNKRDASADASARGWAALSLAQKREQRLALGENKANETATYRQQLINDMIDGVDGSGEIVKAAVKGNPAYKGELRIDYLKNQPEILVLKIPDKNIVTTVDGETRTKTIPGRTVRIDKTKANDKITLNKIISELTDEEVNLSQFMTEGGKKKVKDGKGATKVSEPSSDPLNLF